MARVETVVPAELTAKPTTVRTAYRRLYPSEIQIDPTLSVRQGPPRANEPARIRALAQSLREVGQIEPIVVAHRPDGAYVLIAGSRRLKAARLLSTTTTNAHADGDTKGVIRNGAGYINHDGEFLLDCFVFDEDNEQKALKMAVHENLKRSNLSPLDFAYLCEHVRQLYGWTGTKEVAQFLGVSRAQVSQHDKLLVCPDGMEEAVYENLLDKISSGAVGADAAFYALTHVEPQKAEGVLTRAAAIAASESDKTNGTDRPAAQTAAQTSQTAQSTDHEPTIEPSSPNAQRRASQQKPKTVKKAAAPSKPVKIAKKHIQQAAREQHAAKETKPKKAGKQKQEQELIVGSTAIEKLLGGPEWPTVMRNFIATLALWLYDEASHDEKDLVSYWKRIAALVSK